MEQRKSTTLTPAGSTKSFKSSGKQDKKALVSCEKTTRTASDKRRHRFTESSNPDRVLRNPSHSKEELASAHLKECEEELARTQNLHPGGDSSYLQGVRFIDSATQTEPPKPYERLEEIKEWWYSENPPLETESEISEETVHIPVPPRRSPEDRVARPCKRSFPCHCRHGPHRSINDSRPRPPWDIQTDRDGRRLDTKEPIALENIINWKEVARIEQRRSSRHAEVPNRSPAYDVPGYRWGVPLCVYDYCPQGYIDPEEDPPAQTFKRPEHQEVINRNPAYDKRGFRWGVPLCVYDYCKQGSRTHSPGSEEPKSDGGVNGRREDQRRKSASNVPGTSKFRMNSRNPDSRKN